MLILINTYNKILDLIDNSASYWPQPYITVCPMLPIDPATVYTSWTVVLLRDFGLHYLYPHLASERKWQGHIGHNTQAGHDMVTDLTIWAMLPVRMVTHASLNWAHDCLTSLINQKHSHLATEARYSLLLEVLSLIFAGFVACSLCFIRLNHTPRINMVGSSLYCLNLAWWMVPSWGYGQFLGWLVSVDCRHCGIQVFYWGTSLGSFLLLMLLLWWFYFYCLIHILSHSTWRYTYLVIFSVAIFWMLQSLVIATPIIRHMSVSFSLIMKCGLLWDMCLSVIIWEFQSIVTCSFSVTLFGLCSHQDFASTLIPQCLHMSRCIWEATWLFLSRYWSTVNVWHPDTI